MLGGLNINLYGNGTLLREKNKNLVKGTNKISSEAKKYLEFCEISLIKQIIQSPISVTHNILPY